MLKRRHFIYAIIIAAFAISWYFYNDLTTKFKCVKSKEVVWFARQFDCNNSICTENIKNWNDSAFIVLENEWKNRVNLMKKNFITKTWIPLNFDDSQKLESQWNKVKEHYENCPAHSDEHFNEKCKVSKEELFKKSGEILVMNNLYKAYTFLNKKHGFLLPIYWENEKKIWMIVRGDVLYKVHQKPHMSYFQEIQPDSEMQNFYQPVSESKHCDKSLFAKENLPEIENFNHDRENKSYSHLIFVVHGIGHHKGEESIVENAYDVRNGFSKYLKKFQPHIDMPMVIPIAWRHNLSLNDEIIWTLSLIKEEHVNTMGLIINDVFYYLRGFKKMIIFKFIEKINLKYAEFKERNPNFDGKISILAHSLGTVITFDALNDFPNQFNRKLFENLENLFFIGSPLSRFIASDAFCLKSSNETSMTDGSNEFENLSNAVKMAAFELQKGLKIGKLKSDKHLTENFIVLLKREIKKQETDTTLFTMNCSPVDPDELRKNRWIKNGKLFNVLHSDDPIAQRLEVFFNKNYTFVEPFTLSLHKSFHRSFWKSAAVSEDEKTEIAKFHHRLNGDRQNASSHNGFLQYEFEKHTFNFKTFSSNYSFWNRIAEGEYSKKPWSLFMMILEMIFEFLSYLLNDLDSLFEFITHRIEKENILEETKQIEKIEYEKRLLHRLDYDLKEIAHPDFKSYANLFATEKKFINWATEVVFTHMSYWKRPEVTFLMANIIYGYNSTIYEELSPASSEFNADVSSNRLKYLIGSIWAILSILLVKWLSPAHTSLINYDTTLNVHQVDHWMNDFLYAKYLIIKISLWVAAFIRLFLKALLAIIFWAVLCISPLIPSILGIIFETFQLTLNYKLLVYLIFFLPALLNLMIWEQHLNRETLRRFIKNILFTTTLIIFLACVLCYVSELYRQFETKCRNPGKDGHCLRYEMVKTAEATNLLTKTATTFLDVAKWFKTLW